MSIVAILPAVDEPGIDSTVRSLLGQTTPPDRIIVALNNTDDPDATRLPALAVGDPRVEVIDHGTCPGRKAEAINRTLELLDREGLVMVVDADTSLAPTFIERALVELQDPAVGGVGAVFRGEPPTSYLGLCQVLEYERYAEEVGRTKRTFVMSGTASVIRWSALEVVREHFGYWYSETIITEDSFLSLQLKTVGWVLRSPVECRSTTELMPTVSALFKQRRRWYRGAIENVTTLGFNRVTRPYIRQQVMLAVSVLLLWTLIIATAVSVALNGWQTPQLFWLAVGAVFVTERVLTVWDQPVRYRLFAALIFPELAYSLVLQTAYVAAVYQKLTGSAGSWHHVTAPQKEAQIVRVR